MRNSKFKMAVGAAVQALLISLFSLFIAPSARAVIPEPDNILYGTISLDNVPVTAARTDVVIEARRTTNGPAVASYRMGANPAFGNFYSLRLAVETLTPASDGNASQVADTLFIVVTDGTGLRAQTSYAIPERGSIQRVDFGAVASDTDGDGLPDSWELRHFSNLNQNGGSPAADGQTVLQSFTAGTDPNDPAGAFRISLTLSNDQQIVSFHARKAEGIGYEGRTRQYALLFATDPGGIWQAVPGYSGITGTNQTTTFQAPLAGPPTFYRGQVTLTP